MTGLFRWVVIPSPIWRKVFCPQAQSVSSPLTATVWNPSAANDANPVPTSTGAFHCVVVPSPSWPQLLSPQAQSAPLDVSATVCRPMERRRRSGSPSALERSLPSSDSPPADRRRSAPCPQRPVRGNGDGAVEPRGNRLPGWGRRGGVGRRGGRSPGATARGNGAGKKSNRDGRALIDPSHTFGVRRAMAL